jgi:sugar lactone lactonase YvrE
MGIATLGIAALVSGRLAAQRTPAHEWHAQYHRIIRADSLGAAEFSWALLSPQGALAVAAPGDSRLWLFTVDGQFIATAGRAGSGPNEFRSLGHHGLTDNGFWVADVPNGRIHFIDWTGSITRSVRLPQQVSFPATLLPWHPHLSLVEGISDDGEWIISASSTIAPDGTTAAGGVGSRMLVRAARNGAVATMLAIVRRGTCFQAVDIGGQPGAARRPFCIEPMFQVAPQGTRVVAGTWRGEDATSGFQVVVVATSGDTLWTWDSKRPWVSYASSVRDSAVQAMVNRMPAGEIQRTLRRQLKADAHAPPFDRLVIGTDNSVWLRRTASGAEATWDILSSDGRPLGTARLPSDMNVQTVSEQTVVGLTTDIDGFVNVEILHSTTCTTC